MSIEKADFHIVDSCKDEALSNKDVPASADQDYSGAVAKTDQEEIDLVWKMDKRIMPTLWAMYFL